MSPSANTNYVRLRKALLDHGLTLRSFAKKYGFKAPTVYNAARGDRHGVVAVRIMRKLMEVTDAQKS
jgi:transcriptional regulator with XRE-family HTH domain